MSFAISAIGPAVSQHEPAESKFGPVNDEQAIRIPSVKNRRTGSAGDDVLAALDDDSVCKPEDRRRHLNLHRRGNFEEETVIGVDCVGGERAAARLLRKGLRDGRVREAVLARPRGIVEGGPDRRLYIFLQELAGGPTRDGSLW